MKYARGLCLALFFLVAAVQGRAPEAYYTLRVEPSGGVFQSDDPLPACFSISSPLIGGRYCVERTGAATYVTEPPFRHGGIFIVDIAALLPELIFADGFESWGWVDGEMIPGRWTGALGLRRWPGMLRGGHWYPVAHLHSAAGNDFLFSTVFGDSVSTDTPASTPYLPYLAAGQVIEWTAYDISNGRLSVGGVVSHREIVFTASNREDPYTHEKPLDGLLGETFAGEEFILYAVDPVNAPNGIGLVPGEIADGQILFRGTVIDSSFSGGVDEQFTWTAREQTAEGLAVPSSPHVWRGLGRGVAVEDGGSPSSGARILRADHSGLRSTASQWWSATLRFGGDDSGSAIYTILEAPTFRLRRDPSPAFTLVSQVRRADGTWVTVGTSPSWTSDVVAILVNYDSATTTAYLWVDGASAGSASIGGGIYTAGAASTAWYNAPGTGTAEIRHYNFRHGLSKLSDAVAADRCLYPFDFAQAVTDGNLDCAIEFLEGSGVNLYDFSNNVSAVLTGFSDADGAWLSTATGEPSQARVRTPVFVGAPFMAKAYTLDVAFQVFTAGFDGLSAVPRSVVASGSRLPADFTTTPLDVDYASWFATTQEVDPGLFVPEPAVGQTINFSAGSNAGNHSVVAVLWDPITAPQSGKLTVNGTVLADETDTAGTWSTAGAVWSTIFAADGTGILSVQVDSGATDDMALLLVPPAVPDSLIETYLEKCGPKVASVTKTNIATLVSYGWQGDGAVAAAIHADELAKATPSTNYLPTCVFRASSGAWNISGMYSAPSAADFTLDDRQIANATEKALPRRYGSVRVRYARAWAPSQQGSVSAADSLDRLAKEGSVEWRNATSGTGANELVIDSYFLSQAKAQSFADAMLTLVTTARIYAIQIYGPITKELAAAEPFDVFDVTWSADSFLFSGRKGTLVGWSVETNDNSATAVVLFIP